MNNIFEGEAEATEIAAMPGVHEISRIEHSIDELKHHLHGMSELQNGLGSLYQKVEEIKADVTLLKTELSKSQETRKSSAADERLTKIPTKRFAIGVNFIFSLLLFVMFALFSILAPAIYPNLQKDMARELGFEVPEKN